LAVLLKSESQFPDWLVFTPILVENIHLHQVRESRSFGGPHKLIRFEFSRANLSRGDGTRRNAKSEETAQKAF